MIPYPPGGGLLPARQTHNERAPHDGGGSPADIAPPPEDGPPAGDGLLRAREPHDGDPPPNVSPQEQQAYDAFVKNAYRVIYDDRTFPAIINSLCAHGDPVEGLAHAVAAIVAMLKQGAEAQGKTIPADILLHGGSEILSDLADRAGEIGVHHYSDEEVERASYLAVDLFREGEESRGTLDKAASIRDMETLAEADRSGALEHAVPGFSNYARQLAARGQEGNEP